MATKKAETETTSAPKQTDEFADCYGELGDAPDGFVNESRPDVKGWWKAEAGLMFKGKLVGGFAITDKDGTKRNVVLVELVAPTKAYQTKSDGGKAIRLEKGDVLGVGISAALTPLLNYIEHNGLVRAKVTGQKEVGRPQPMWTYEIQCKGEKSAPPALSEPAGSPEDDEIPF